MSVDFTDNGDDTSDCDVCGETIDNDHYADMQAHDEKHAAERDKVAAMPPFVIMRQYDDTWFVLEKCVLGNGRAYYRPVSRSTSSGDAERIADAMERI